MTCMARMARMPRMTCMTCMTRMTRLPRMSRMSRMPSPEQQFEVLAAQIANQPLVGPYDGVGQ
jgi:hypothetical protein